MAANQQDRARGFADDVWWSREAPPHMQAWSDGEPVRLVEKTVPAQDPEGKAMAGDGLYVPTARQMLWRFVGGRPVSVVTCAFLAWLRANGPSCGSGTMLPDTSARRCRHGSTPTIATPNRRGAVASWSVGYRARVPGSIRLSLSGCMGNGPWWNPLVCSPRLNS